MTNYYTAPQPDTLWERNSIWYRVIKVGVGKRGLKDITVVYKAICPSSPMLRVCAIGCSVSYWKTHFKPLGRLSNLQDDQDTRAKRDTLGKQIATQFQK